MPPLPEDPCIRVAMPLPINADGTINLQQQLQQQATADIRARQCQQSMFGNPTSIPTRVPVFIPVQSPPPLPPTGCSIAVPPDVTFVSPFVLPGMLPGFRVSGQPEFPQAITITAREFSLEEIAASGGTRVQCIFGGIRIPEIVPGPGPVLPLLFINPNGPNTIRTGSISVMAIDSGEVYPRELDTCRRPITVDNLPEVEVDCVARATIRYAFNENPATATQVNPQTAMVMVTLAVRIPARSQAVAPSGTAGVTPVDPATLLAGM